MMYKVSFKGKDAKEVKRYSEGRVTVVTLHGNANLITGVTIPNPIWEWLNNYSSSNISIDLAPYGMDITCLGKAKRAEGDIDNPVLAERIAECRAKINLYKFMRKFCGRMLRYYEAKVYGEVNMNGAPAGHNTLYAAYRQYIFLLFQEKHHLIKLLKNESSTENPT